MNELILVTDTLLYRPGDVVTGHVWLDICTPTTGKSLRISLTGIERCEQLSVGKEDSKVYTHQLVPDGDHLLWEAHETFPFGSYRAPFELLLPNNTPDLPNARTPTSCKQTCLGSFQCYSLEGWRLCVTYTVQAYVVEDSALSDSDLIVVSQPSPSLSPPQQPKKCQTFEVKQFLGLSKAQLVLDCSLQEEMVKRSHTFSSQLTFDVSVLNTSKTYKIVKRRLKLVQCLTLCGPCVLTESVINFVSGNCYRGDSLKPSDRMDINFNTLAPERAPSNAAKSATEWQRVILATNVCDKNSCSAIFDLSQCDRRHLFEGSISGETIKCQYQVVLTVTLDDGDTFSSQPCDIWIHSHTDTKHMPSNVEKLTKVKQLPMFEDATSLDESLTSSQF